MPDIDVEKAVRRLKRLPLVKWRKELDRMPAGRAWAVTRAILDEIRGLARLASYCEVRGNGHSHEDGVKAQNAFARKIGKACGYPTNAVINF